MRRIVHGGSKMNIRKLVGVSAVALVAAAAGTSARASTLDGSEAYIEYYTYGYDYGSQGNFTVPNATPLNILFPIAVLTITDNRIEYYFREGVTFSPSVPSLNADGLYIENGPLVSFAGAAPITSVFIDPSSILGASGFNASNVTFNSSAVAVTWAGLPFSVGDLVILDVNAVPLPAALPMFGAALAGFGGLGWWRRRKTA